MTRPGAELYRIQAAGYRERAGQERAKRTRRTIATGWHDVSSVPCTSRCGVDWSEAFRSVPFTTESVPIHAATLAATAWPGKVLICIYILSLSIYILQLNPNNPHQTSQPARRA